MRRRQDKDEQQPPVKLSNYLVQCHAAELWLAEVLAAAAERGEEVDV